MLMMKEDEDYNSDEDSDYDPNQDKEGNENENGDGDDKQVQTSRLVDISVSRKRKIDELFNEMCNEDMKSCTRKAISSTVDSGSIQSKTSSRKKAKSEKLLASIFGKTTAAEICTKESKSRDTNRSTTDSGDNVRARALEIARNVQKTTVVTEKRKFAGKENG